MDRLTVTLPDDGDVPTANMSDLSSDGETVHSDEDGEEPYYPETERTLVGHSRSGRPIYSVARLVVPNAVIPPKDDDEESESESENDSATDIETQSDDSFVTDADENAWNSDEYQE